MLLLLLLLLLLGEAEEVVEGGRVRDARGGRLRCLRLLLLQDVLPGGRLRRCVLRVPGKRLPGVGAQPREQRLPLGQRAERLPHAAAGRAVAQVVAGGGSGSVQGLGQQACPREQGPVRRQRLAREAGEAVLLHGVRLRGGRAGLRGGQQVPQLSKVVQAAAVGLHPGAGLGWPLHGAEELAVREGTGTVGSAAPLPGAPTLVHAPHQRLASRDRAVHSRVGGAEGLQQRVAVISASLAGRGPGVMGGPGTPVRASSIASRVV